MVLCLRSKKILALVLVLALLSARWSSFSQALFVEPIQQYLAQSAFLEDGGVKHNTVGLLKQKPLITDTLLPKDAMAPLVYIPSVPEAYPPFPDRALPEVYLKTYIPPA